jgi:LacI family transcriptional regulator
MGGATIRDVAALAFVSKATVSRVLNNKPDVDPVTAERVRRVMTQVGYTPRASAVGLARGSSDCVGVVTPSISWPWVTPLLQAVADRLETAGMGFLLYTLAREQQSRDWLMRQGRRASFDGLIAVMPPGEFSFFQQQYDRGMPVALIDDRMPHPELPTVRVTDREGAASAAEHVLARGCRRPVVLGGFEDYIGSRDRLDGVTAVCADAGIVLAPEHVVRGNFTEQGGYRGTEQLLEQVPDLDAVLAHNDQMALGALRCLLDRGVTVPDDVCVVGFDDIEFAALSRPRLSTVRQPLVEMGYVAAEMVLQGLGGQIRPPGPRVLATQLVVRESS